MSGNASLDVFNWELNLIKNVTLLKRIEKKEREKREKLREKNFEKDDKILTNCDDVKDIIRTKGIKIYDFSKVTMIYRKFRFLFFEEKKKKNKRDCMLL